VGEESREQRRKEPLVGLMDLLPDRVGNTTWARGYVLEDFRSAEDTSAGRTRGTSLNAGRMRGGGGEGLGGKEML